jgi:hypothetical protein
VTAELALGALGLVAVVFGLTGLFALVIMQIRCVDAAGEIARQAARGDQAAVAQVEARLPATATVTGETAADVVRVHVAVPMSPWGDWLGTITVTADASTRREGAGT